MLVPELEALRRAMSKAEVRRVRAYGLSPEEYIQRLDEQDNSCDIGREPFDKTPHIDHDHATGEPRGLLCLKCNTGLSCSATTRRFSLRGERTCLGGALFQKYRCMVEPNLGGKTLPLRPRVDGRYRDINHPVWSLERLLWPSP